MSNEKKEAPQGKVQVGFCCCLSQADADRVKSEFIAAGKTAEVRPEGDKFHVYAYTK